MDSNFPSGFPEMPKFSSPEEELRFLREALRRREAELSLQSIEAKKKTSPKISFLPTKKNQQKKYCIIRTSCPKKKLAELCSG
jgi:hypothetical protein